MFPWIQRREKAILTMERERERERENNFAQHKKQQRAVGLCSSAL